MNRRFTDVARDSLDILHSQALGGVVRLNEAEVHSHHEIVEEALDRLDAMIKKEDKPATIITSFIFGIGLIVAAALVVKFVFWLFA